MAFHAANTLNRNFKDINIGDDKYRFNPKLNDLLVNNYAHITFGNGVFVISTMGGYSPKEANLWWSEDGVKWTRGDAPNADYRQVIFGAGKFLAITYGKPIMTISYDGKHWETVNIPYGPLVVGYGNGMFVAYISSDNQFFVYSYDGVNWEQCEPYYRVTRMNIHCIKYGGGVWLAIAGKDDIQSVSYVTNDIILLRSFDGIHWFNDVIEIPDKFDGTKSTNGLAWSPVGGQYGTWVAAMCYGMPWYSLDQGITWKESSGLKYSNTPYYYVIYGGGLFAMCVCARELNWNYNVGFSYDGIKWFNDDNTTQFDRFVDIAYGNNRFVALGGGVREDTTPHTAIIMPPQLKLSMKGNNHNFTESGDIIDNGHLYVNTMTSNNIITQAVNLKSINNTDFDYLVSLVMELKKKVLDTEQLRGYIIPYYLKWENIGLGGNSLADSRYALAALKDKIVFVGRSARDTPGMWFTTDYGNTYTTARVNSIATPQRIIAFDGFTHTGVVMYLTSTTEYAYGNVITEDISYQPTVSSLPFVVGDDLKYVYGACNGDNQPGRLVLVSGLNVATGYPDKAEKNVTDGLVQPVPFTKVTIPNTTGYEYKSIAYGKGKFILINWTTLYSSTDGYNWKEITSMTNIKNNWAAITYCSFERGFFVLAAADGYTSISYDGETWTTPAASIDTPFGIGNMVYANGTLIAVANGSNNLYWFWTYANRMDQWQMGGVAIEAWQGNYYTLLSYGSQFYLSTQYTVRRLGP